MTDLSSGPRSPATPGTYRVPRSQIDNLYDPAELLPDVRVGTGVVTSIDGVDVCTVAFEDENITGVVFQGEPPATGDVVEVELRGDLFVIAAVSDLSITEISTDGAAHIVRPTTPEADRSGSASADRCDVGSGCSRPRTSHWAGNYPTTGWPPGSPGRRPDPCHAVRPCRSACRRPTSDRDVSRRYWPGPRRFRSCCVTTRRTTGPALPGGDVQVIRTA